MERMLVSEYIALQADEQKPKTVKALMGMYVMELMGKVNLTAEISYDEFFDSLLDTECVRRDGYVTLAPDWSKDRIFQKIGGQA